MNIEVCINHTCEECGEKMEINVVMIDGPERGSWDYPGAGATWEIADERDLHCQKCQYENDKDFFDSVHGDEIQEKIAESLADRCEPDYPED